MKSKFKFVLGNKLISISMLILVLFGSLMIASAEMGNSVGDPEYLTRVIIKQVIFALIGLLGYFIAMNINVKKIPMFVYWILYVLLLCALISCRFFAQTNGAYAWIRLSDFVTIQPSEFAKVFMIIFGSRLLCSKNNRVKNFYTYGVCLLIYFSIIFVLQHDLGSAVVLLLIGFCIMFITPYEELDSIQTNFLIAIIIAILAVIIMFLPFVNEFLRDHTEDYRIARFLAADNPFLYRYDYGYHIIMSLVSFANGNIIGLGYGNSIHKYMNFPNPSNDFILPVIVEELGIVGFVGFVVMYALMLIPIIRMSMKTKYVTSKQILFGTFIYFISHFILNVGGVSGFIPLTGVPLLLISSGGTSLLASLMALGFAQAEIIRNKGKEDENNRRQIQENAN